MSARPIPPIAPVSEEKQMERFIAHVEKKALGAPDDRTRFIRLMVLALAQASRSQMVKEGA